MKLAPVRRVKLYEQVVSLFTEKADAGELKRGDKLPPERDLVDQLGVSRAVLREALRVLEVKGILETVPGEGRIYAGNSMADVERINAEVRKAAVLEILDARQAIECMTAELAAERADSKDLRRLKSLVQQRPGVTGAAAYNYEKNCTFHLAIAAAARNAVLGEILRMVLNLRADVHRIDLLDEAAYAETFREHADIVDAIESGEPCSASNLMRAHIQQTKKKIQDISS